MDDLISRQAAIDALKEYRAFYCNNTPDAFSKLSYVEKSRVNELDMAIATLCNLPSAQSERLTDDDFETIRIHLSAIKEGLCNQHRWKEAEEYQHIIDRFMTFASAQPEPIKISINDLNKEDWGRLKKEWVNTPVTVLSAQPERKKGKWIKRGPSLYKCSECARFSPTQENFCPNCGADMREEKTDD